MSPEIAHQIHRLADMGLADLKAMYLQVFNETPRSRHKDQLRRQIAWRLQANEEGDLGARARERAFQIANDADLRLTAPLPAAPAVSPQRQGKSRSMRRLPPAGTVLSRRYKGRVIEVVVQDDNVVFEGDCYSSLSAVAKRVTGSHWNGFRFFGIDRKVSQP